jgi:superoxide dismutase
MTEEGRQSPHWLSIAGESAEDPLKKFPDLKKAIIDSFGPLEGMKHAFARAAGELFGSGWVWLVSNEKTGKLGTE